MARRRHTPFQVGVLVGAVAAGLSMLVSAYLAASGRHSGMALYPAFPGLVGSIVTVPLGSQKLQLFTSVVLNALVYGAVFHYISRHVLPWCIDWRDRKEERRLRGQCEDCGYDLTGNISGQCPECGTRVPESRS